MSGPCYSAFPGRARRGTGLALVFASVLATGGTTGSWGDQLGTPRATSPSVDPASNEAPFEDGAQGPPSAPGGGDARTDRDLPPERAGSEDADELVSRSGDRWSSTYSPEEYQRFQRSLEGSYIGVGISVRRARTAGGAAVVAGSVRPGSPADKAGIRPGDRLRTIDGERVADRPVTEVVARLRGSSDGGPEADTGVRGPKSAPDEKSPPDEKSGNRSGSPSETPGPPDEGKKGGARGGSRGDTSEESEPDRNQAGERGRTELRGHPDERDGRHGDTPESRSRQKSPGGGDPDSGQAGPGSSVAVKLSRDGRTWQRTLHRARLTSESVTVSDAGPGAVRIKVSSFTKGTGERVRKAVEQSVPEGSGVLLDLRGNSGGLVEEAVGTASAFLDGGLVGTYDDEGAQRALFAERGGDPERPLVVLVDGGTMSAAELLAGALRDRGRAVVVGSTTFGKGSVQIPREQADGSVAELTVGEYVTPAGYRVENVGITPDLPLDESVHGAPGAGRGGEGAGVRGGAKEDATSRARTVLSGLGTPS